MCAHGSGHGPEAPSRRGVSMEGSYTPQLFLLLVILLMITLVICIGVMYI